MLESNIVLTENNIYDLNNSKIYIKLMKLSAVKTYYIELNETLESISIKEYGSDEYWWIIGLYNHIIDPFAPELEQRVLKLLSRHDMDNLLATTRIKENG